MAKVDNPIEITVEQFRESYPEFEDPPYTDAVVLRFINLAYCYMDNTNYGLVKDECRLQALMLWVAHLLTIWNNINTYGASSGSVGSTTAMGIAQKAKVGEVELSLQLPTIYNLFQAWLNSTMYGQMLWSLCYVHTPPAMYFGGRKNNLFWTR